MRTRLSIVTAAITLGLLLTACTPTDEPSPTPSATTASPTESPSPTPTETITPDPQTANIEEARQTVVDYIAVVNTVAQNSYATWTDLLPFWGAPAVTNPQSAVMQAEQADGSYMEGEVVLQNLTVVEYIADPTGTGYEQVRVDYCLDYSARTLHNADGSIMENQTLPRFMWSGLLQHQGGERWSFIELTAQRDVAC